MDFKDLVRQYSIRHSIKTRKILTALNETLEANAFNYYAVSSKGEFTFISSNPDFAEYYADQRFFEIDSLLRHPSNFSSGTIFWSSFLDGTKDILREIEPKFDMCHGLSLLKKSTDPRYEIEGFCFTASKGHNTFQNQYMNDYDLFHNFCIYLKEEMSSIIKEMSHNPVDVGKLKGKCFFEVNPPKVRLSSTARANAKTTFFVPSSSNEKDTDLIQTLSSRQRQCLNLLLSGKSAGQTGEALGLSRRTIEHYLESVKNKLNCENRAELFERFRTII